MKIALKHIQQFKKQNPDFNWQNFSTWSMEAFNENRSRCIIATMKTTIRERWQEVVEELNRTNIPSIHLLTLDTGITENVLTLMKNHNITLVTYREIKAKFPLFTNVMDFEAFFGSEIPHTLEWWAKNS